MSRAIVPTVLAVLLGLGGPVFIAFKWLLIGGRPADRCCGHWVLVPREDHEPR